MRFELSRRLSRRSVGISFSSTQVGLAVNDGGTVHTEAFNLSNERALREALGAVRKDLTDCAVSVSLSDCAVTAVSLPMVSTRELRNITAQAYFWQERLGIAADDCYVWWKRLPGRNAHETRVLIAAIERSRLHHCIEFSERAGLRTLRFGISFFDYLAAVQRESRGRAVLLLLDGKDAGLADFDGADMRLSRARGVLAEPGSTESYSEKLSGLIQKLCGDDNAVRVVKTVGTLPEHADILDRLGEILSARFEFSAVSAQQLAGVEVMTAPCAAHAAIRLRYAHCHVNFKDSGGGALTWRHIQVPAVAIGLLSWGLDAYLHWHLSEEAYLLERRLEQRTIIAAEYEAGLRQWSRIRDEHERHAAVIEKVNHLQSVHKMFPRLIEAVETAVVPGIWLNKVAFESPPAFRIHGKSTGAEAIARYAAALLRHGDIAEVQISNVTTEDDGKFQDFVLVCSLREPVTGSGP